MKLNQEKVWKIYSETVHLYHNILFSSLGKKGLDYLENRKISIDSIKKYKLGFAPYSTDKKFLYNTLVRSFRFDVKDLLETGLLSIDLDKGAIKDTFGTQRIIMPVIENGNVTTFSARTIIDGVEPRYKTIKYNKLGVFNSDIIDKVKTIYICEGILDTISLNQIGFHSIGILGLNVFGKEHCGILNNFNGNIVLTLDNDENNSAQQAVERIGNILFDCGKINVYVKTLNRENGEKKSDINSLLEKHGVYKSALLFHQMEVRKFIPTLNNLKIKRSGTYITTDKVSLLSILSNIVPNIIQCGHDRLKCICPFPDHKDTEPSFTVYLSQDGDRYKCYGCSRSGNVLGFIMEYYNLNFKEALLKIKDFKD